MLATLLALFAAHKAALITAATAAVELFLRKKPGATPILQKAAAVLTAADGLLNSVPGLKNNDGK